MNRDNRPSHGSVLHGHSLPHVTTVKFLGGAINACVALSVLIACQDFPLSGQERTADSIPDLRSFLVLGSPSVRVSPTGEAFLNGQGSLRVEFLPASWPAVKFTSRQPVDWTRFGGLSLDLTNPGPEPVTIGIRVDDEANASGTAHCLTGSAAIAPGGRQTCVLPLADLPEDLGMRVVPAPVGAQMIPARRMPPFTLGQVVSFSVFMNRPDRPVALSLSNPRLVARLSLDGIVDGFGQFSRAAWPGKVTSSDAMKRQRQTEARELETPDETQGGTPLDRFGGWIHGPSCRRTGFFHAERVDGRWWLVTPEGHPFFSLGLNSITSSNPTVITGRESMLSWLPKAGEPLSSHLGKAGGKQRETNEKVTFDFYGANLERKYGEDYEREWLVNVSLRMRSWGFNTVGNWSDPRLRANPQIPYVMTVLVPGDHDVIGREHGMKMPDPFDPRFADDLASSVRPAATRVREDPWCLGYFVQNELSWGSGRNPRRRYALPLAVLGCGADQPARRAFMEDLRAAHLSIEKLNAAWGTRYSGWEEISKPSADAVSASPAMQRDLSRFSLKFARRYFMTVRGCLTGHDPNHLYLGCRFGEFTPEAAQAAAEFADVVSFNVYAAALDRDRWRFAETLGKPCLVSEFHFGARDRGMFGAGLVAARDQEDRAKMYSEYVKSVAANPAFVGCHWFKYADQPLIGTVSDGENFNIGFVNVADIPYPELVNAAKSAHRGVLQILLESKGAALAFPRRADPPRP